VVASADQTGLVRLHVALTFYYKHPDPQSASERPRCAGGPGSLRRNRLRWAGRWDERRAAAPL